MTAVLLSEAARLRLAHPGATLVVDIDGTLALDTARQHLRPKANPHCLTGTPLPEIAAYMAPELVARDAPILGAARLIEASKARPLIVTARWHTLRDTTAAWLRRHFPTLWSRHRGLRMREYGDMRSSVDVKLDLVSLLDSRNGVWLDDDDEMLAAAERHGFIPLKAPEIFESA